MYSLESFGTQLGTSRNLLIFTSTSSPLLLHPLHREHITLEMSLKKVILFQHDKISHTLLTQLGCWMESSIASLSFRVYIHVFITHHNLWMLVYKQNEFSSSLDPFLVIDGPHFFDITSSILSYFYCPQISQYLPPFYV